MKTEQLILNVDASFYNSIKAMEQMYELTKTETPKKMKKEMEETIEAMKEFIPGNVD